MFSVRHSGNVTIVQPEIDTLDEPAGRGLVAAIRELIQPEARIVLNLARVTYVNSAALGYIATSCRRLHHHRGQLAVCCLQDRPKSVFEFTRMDRILSGIFDTEQAALESLQESVGS